MPRPTRRQAVRRRAVPRRLTRERARILDAMNEALEQANDAAWSAGIPRGRAGAVLTAMKTQKLYRHLNEAVGLGGRLMRVDDEIALWHRAEDERVGR